MMLRTKPEIPNYLIQASTFNLMWENKLFGGSILEGTRREPDGEIIRNPLGEELLVLRNSEQ